MSPLTFGQQNFVVSVALSSYGRCERLGLCLRGRVQVRAIERGVARDAAHHELLELHEDLHNPFQTGGGSAGHLLDDGVGYCVLINGSHEGTSEVRAGLL